MPKYLRNISYKLRSNVKFFLSDSYARVETLKKFKIYIWVFEKKNIEKEMVDMVDSQMKFFDRMMLMILFL